MQIGLTENCKVSNQGFDLRREEFAASGTGQNIGGPKIHEANLAECVAAQEDARYLVLVVVGVVTNWAIDIHNSKFN